MEDVHADAGIRRQRLDELLDRLDAVPFRRREHQVVAVTDPGGTHDRQQAVLLDQEDGAVAAIRATCVRA